MSPDTAPHLSLSLVPVVGVLVFGNTLRGGLAGPPVFFDFP